MDEQIRQIAKRLEGLRDVTGLSIEDFAKHCHVSTEDYQTAEAGRADISISFLSKIARHNHISIEELMFGEEPHLSNSFVTRAGRGIKVERVKAYKYQSLAAGFKNRIIDPFLVTIEPSERPMTFSHHEGQEFTYVLKGQLLISLSGREIILHPGDSVYYSSKQPHGLCAKGDEPVECLVISAL